MSKYIKSESVKFKVSHVACALIAAVAASATVTVHAADPLYWTGGEKATSTEESPYDIWNAANWGGYTPSRNYNPDISANGTTYLNSGNGGTIGYTTYLNSGDYVFTGSLTFYNGLKVGTNENSTVSITKKSGDWTFQNLGHMELGKANNATVTFVNESGNVTLNGGNITLGGSSDGSGLTTLTIKGGTVTVPSDKSVQLAKGAGTINLDGGTLVTPKIERKGGNGTTIQYINFNGGTLKANNEGKIISAPDGYLYVIVNAGGGTIDCNGKAIEIGQCPRVNDFKGAGGLTFTGGNTITINRSVSYSGATSVTPGTTLAVANETAKNNILANGLVVAGTPTKADVGKSVFTYTSALDDDDLTKVSCPLVPDARFGFSDNGKTNIVIKAIGPQSGLVLIVF